MPASSKVLFFISTILIATRAMALNIALTNDDGWDAPGIQALRSALLAAGHRVTLAGSSENQSGSSAAIDFGQANIVVTKQFEDGSPQPGGDMYSVALKKGGGAEPATAGQLAIAIASQGGAPVDLLLSGINAGANLGAFTNFSGTVGAVIHGVSLASGARVPAIAISTDEPQGLHSCKGNDREACVARSKQHYDRVAAWMVAFIAELEKKPGKLAREQGLLPPGIALNINYPPVAKISGVRSSVQGLLPMIMGNASALHMGCYADCVKASIGTGVPAGIVRQQALSSDDTGHSERKDADTEVYNKGYVSIVAIDTDLTASKKQRRIFSGLIDQLNRPRQ